MIQEDTFETLYRDQLHDLYDAERQITEALPDMITAASSEDLKAAFAEHLEQTREQISRLDRIFAELGEQPGSKTSDGMRALLAQGRLHINERSPSPVLDAALIAAAQKVEHYEISGYGSAVTMAEMLDHEQDAMLLEQTLDEEKDTDATLSDIAEDVLGGEELEDEEELDDEELAS